MTAVSEHSGMDASSSVSHHRRAGSWGGLSGRNRRASRYSSPHTTGRRMRVRWSYRVPSPQESLSISSPK